MELNDVPENIFNISADDLTLANLEKINIFYESIDNQSDIHVRNLIRHIFKLLIHNY